MTVAAENGKVTVSYRLVPKQHRLVPRMVEPKPPPRRRPSDRTARMLALAHHVEALLSLIHI